MTSLRQLRFLVALADEMNFSRAAEACHVTQPALSAGLKDLEKALGVVLAERTKRSVILTPIGHTIAGRARQVLAEVQDIEDLAARSSGLLRGELKLGTIPTVGPFLIPKALPLLRKRFPDLKLYLREELSESLLEGITTGRLDAVLLALPFDIGPLESELLFEDGYHMAEPLRAARSGRKFLRGPDLAGSHLLLLEKGHCLQRHALSAFPEVDLVQDETFAATSLTTLVSMVEEGLGITLLPNIAVEGGIATGHAIELTPLQGAYPRRVVLAWRRTSAFSADFRALAAVLREARAAGSAPRQVRAGEKRAGKVRVPSGRRKVLSS